MISIMTHDLEPCYLACFLLTINLSFWTSDMGLSFWSLGLKDKKRKKLVCNIDPELF